MTQSKSTRVAIYGGIDVAQDWLDVFLHPLRKYKRFPNTTQGISKLFEYLAEQDGEIAKVVLEATGGLEYQAASACKRPASRQQ